jgi:PAS domain S-box-containing protein
VPRSRAWIVGVRQNLARSLVAALAALAISGASLADAEERKTLLVGSESDYPPYAITSETGEADGFSVDLIKAVAEQKGLDIAFRIGSWSEVKALLEAGEIDLLPHVYYSHERDKAFDFSVTHTSADAAWFVRTGEDADRAVKDFHGRSVVAMRSDWTHEYLLANDLTDDVFLVDTVPEALQALSAGQHDAAFLPLLVGRLLVRDLALSNIEVAGDPVKVGRGFAFAVHEGDTALVQRLNDGLALVQASGRYDEIFEKWFGVVPPRGASESVLVRYAVWVAVGVALAATLIVFWIVLLRRTVARQTAELTQAQENLEARVRERTDELHRSERALAEAQRIAKIGNWRLDVRSGDLYWSDEIYRIFGRTPGEFAPSEKRFFETTHPEDLAAVQESVGKAINQGIPLSIDHRIILPDGTMRWVHEEAVRTLDENGEATVLSGTVQDITERENADETLREREEFPKKLLNDMLTFVAILSTEGEVLFVNNTPLEVGGLKLEQVIGQMFYDAPWWTHRDDVYDTVKQDIARCAKGESIVRDIEIMTADGSLMWIEFSMHPIWDEGGKVQYLIPEGRDITERKTAESLLSRFGRIVEGSLNEVYIFEAKTLKFLQANYGARINLGYSLDEIQRLTPVDIKPTLNSQEFEGLIRPLRNGEAEIVVFETIHERKNGSRYDVEVHIEFMKEENPQIFVATIQDITERKKTELKLQELNSQLEERVKIRTQELSESQQRLSSHIENTPLAVISWNENFECTLWNPAAERIFGFSAAEALGNNALKLLVPKEIHDQIDDIFSKLMSQSGGEHTINENFTKDGRTILC